MKLLNRTSRYYLFFSLLIFLVIGLVLFVVLRLVLNHTTDESLEHTRPALARELGDLRELEPTLYIMDEIVELRPIAAVTEAETYQDTMILVAEDDGELEREPFRKYTYDELVGGKPYRISISLSTLESEDLITTLLAVVLGGLLLFLLAINVLNRYLSRVLWLPFYRTLETVKAFSVQQATAPTFEQSDTTEFEDLNRSLEEMTGLLIKEYDSLRRFTENASHELQTPLAIIRGQIDLLLRGEERSEADYAIIQGMSETVSKLGRLNQTLLLLTKIERGQVPKAEWIDLKLVVERKLEQLAPGMKARGIKVSTKLISTHVSIPMLLADVLLNNLLSNAVRHNVDGGTLDVSLRGCELMIENTGPVLHQRPEAMFERFQKDSKAAESLGLGLAIVQEICDKYAYHLAYEYEAGIHRIRVGVDGTV